MFSIHAFSCLLLQREGEGLFVLDENDSFQYRMIIQTYESLNTENKHGAEKPYKSTHMLTLHILHEVNDYYLLKFNTPLRF